jgi:hypothetical protein
MLFDVRGRGRRRVVRVVYIGLALLFLLGFVGLGVGSFGGGGILSSLTNNEGSSSTSFSGQIKKYKKLTERQPSNLAAWEGLTKNLLHEGAGEAYVTSAGAVTSKGKALFNQTAQAWSSYIALNPPKPSIELAKEMLRVYGAEGLNQSAQAVQVLQLIVAAEPSNASFYAQLAEYAYRAKNVRVGDLASEKAVSLAPATERTRVKSELAEVKKNPSGEKIYTTTTNGKTYAGKLNAKGELAATQVTTTPPPAKGSTTTKKK